MPHGADLVREAKQRLADLPPADRALRQNGLLFRLLPRGIAVHHAGLLPVVKMLVEELFQSVTDYYVAATEQDAGGNSPLKCSVEHVDGTMNALERCVARAYASSSRLVSGERRNVNVSLAGTVLPPSAM